MQTGKRKEGDDIRKMDERIEKKVKKNRENEEKNDRKKMLIRKKQTKTMIGRKRERIQEKERKRKLK